MTASGGEGRMSMAVAVASWNTRELLRACLASLRRHPPSCDLDVWVVDNGSTDGSPEMVEEAFPDVHLIRNAENLGFSVANNQALRQMSADWLVLLNSDAEVMENSLDEAMAVAAAHGQVVAGRLLNPDGSLQFSCFRFPRLWRDLLEAVYLHRLLPRSVRGRTLWGGYWDHADERPIEWALGAFLVLPKTALEKAGLLPEEYFAFGEDMEWCWRLREAGFPVRYVPSAPVVHHGNQSAGKKEPAWRIRLTHAGYDRFLGAHHGPLYALAARLTLRLGYHIRRFVLPLAGRQEAAAEYRHILKVLSTPVEDGKP